MEDITIQNVGVNNLVRLKVLPNTACTRTPHEQRGYRGGSRRVFKQLSWLEVGSVKVVLSRPAHQPSSGCYRDGYPMKSVWGRPHTVSPLLFICSYNILSKTYK